VRTPDTSSRLSEEWLSSGFTPAKGAFSQGPQDIRLSEEQYQSEKNRHERHRRVSENEVSGTESGTESVPYDTKF